MLALGSSTDTTLVDALPYIDIQYNERDRQHALELIANECKVFLPTKNYLRHLPLPDYDIFLSPTLLKEQQRMAKKEEMAKLDMGRCELPPPPASRNADKQAWKKALDNAKAQNEHLSVRECNLNLMDELAAEAMLKNNKSLEKQLSREEERLRHVKEQTLGIHAKRKAAQLEAAAKLNEGEAVWVQMLTKNYQMEMAMNDLERENGMRAKRLNLDLSTLN